MSLTLARVSPPLFARACFTSKRRLRFALSAAFMICWIALPALATIPGAERQALIDLYDATNGPSWIDRTNWNGAAGTECTWNGVICDPGQTHVFEIRLRANGLSGSIPVSLSNLTGLGILELADNDLTGAIPQSVWTLPQLFHLNLMGNDLTGTIDPQPSMRTLLLGGNRLSGGVEPICDCPSLIDLNLGSNAFSGAIPSCVGTLSGLFSFVVPDNQLSGSLPAEIANLKALLRLAVDGNQLTGSILPELGDLPVLEQISFHDNQLTGTIPSSLGNLSALQELSLGSNVLSGGIPPSIGNLSNLRRLGLELNQLTGSLPPEIGNLKNLRHLWANANQLTGGIPTEIGNLTTLEHLALSQNRFSGTIPSSIGNLTGLTLLWLESNALVGEVPGSMASLTNLQPGSLHLGFNGLYTTDPTLKAFLDSRHPAGFGGTQTVAPANVGIASTTDSSVTLRWAPIPYTGDGGGYRVHVATSPTGPFTPATVTSDKLASGATVEKLQPFVSYSFRVDTITPAHGDQQNNITSDLSPVVTATTVSSEGGIAVVDSPDVMAAFADGVSYDSTTLTIANLSSQSGTLLLLPAGSFFTIEQESLTLDPGSTTSVPIVSVPQSTAGDYRGSISLSGSGVVPGTSVGVTLFAAPPQQDGTPRVEVASTRVDVSAPHDENPTGSVSFRNTGDATATGILGADQSWIVPEPSLLDLEPGESRAFSFMIDRAKRPDADELAGTQQGTLSFLYVAGLGNTARRSPFEGVPTLVSPVGITDTVKPTAVDCPPAPMPCWVEIPPLTSGEVGLVAPGVGNVTGSVGLFVSDVSIGNRGGLPVEDLSLYYSGKAVMLPVDSGRVVSLADVSSMVFDETERVSALHLRSGKATEIAMNANVFVKNNPNGTFGTALPVFRTDRGASSGASVVITGLRKTATSHTNFYVQELSGENTTFDVTFLDTAGVATGQLVGQEILAFGTSVLGQALVPEGSVTAIFSNTGTGSIAAFATPVDRASNDTWAVADWGQVYGFEGTETQYVAVAGSAPGRNDTYFQTDLAMYAKSSGIAILRYYQQTPSVTVIERAVSFDAEETLVYDDIVFGFFGATTPSLGSIEIDPGMGLDLTATSRTYTTVKGLPDTFGTGVPSLSSAEALRNGESIVIGGLEDSTATTTDAGTPATFRTNIGLVEIEGSPVRARVSVLLYDGTHLAAGGAVASRTYDLAARQWKQLNAIVGEILGRDVRERDFGELRNVQVRVDVVDGNGAVIVYATTTDNGTGDTVLRLE